MKITIGSFDSDTRTVLVKFKYNNILHQRRINACVDKDGKFDEAATKVRVDEVAAGVKSKIDNGIIVNA